MDLTPLDGKGRWFALISQPLGPPRSPRRSEAPRDRLSLRCLKHCSVSLEEGTSLGSFGPVLRAHFDHLPGLELSPSEESAGSRLQTLSSQRRMSGLEFVFQTPHFPWPLASRFCFSANIMIPIGKGGLGHRARVKGERRRCPHTPFPHSTQQSRQPASEDTSAHWHTHPLSYRCS